MCLLIEEFCGQFPFSVNNDNTIIFIYKAIKLVPRHYWNLCMPNKQMAKSSHNLKYNAGLSNERTLSLLPVWFGVSTNTQLLSCGHNLFTPALEAAKKKEIETEKENDIFGRSK